MKMIRRVIPLNTARFRSLKQFWLICLFFLVSDAYGQSVNVDSISERFNDYSRKNLQEKIYLHTDKDLYLSGEILWFKLYNIGSATNVPLDFSKIAYTEIVDKDQKPVMQVQTAIEKSTGHGSLSLPLDLSTGTYRIRSYTNWMKNFSPDYYFEKPIHIVNTLSKPDKPQIENLKKYDVQFFPEGGNLVEGLSSKIAFRAIDHNGKGIDFSGTIVDDSNDTITRFRPLRYGIGSFNLKPGNERAYRAIVRIRGSPEFSVPLPGTMKSGAVLALKVSSEKLNLTIQSKGSPTEELLLLVHTRQETRITEKIKLNAGQAEIQIDKAKLGDGVSHLTVFNSSGMPLAERLIFKMPENKLVLNIKPDQQLYGSRKKVSLDLEAKTEAGMFSAAEASVSVYASNGSESNSTDIVNYLWLKSDLSGNVEDPAYYFRSTDSQAAEALDNLMLTHGWRRFVWEYVINKKPDVKKFMPEVTGHIISAKITDTRTNYPAKGIVSYLSVPGKNVRLYTARSDSSGGMKFHTRDLYGPSELVAQNNYLRDSTYSIELSSPFSKDRLSFQVLSMALTEDFRDQLLPQSVGNQVQNLYHRDKLRTFYARAQDSSSFYLNPDKSYILDNFVRFNTMEEVLKEYVLEVPVTRQRDDFFMWVSYRAHDNDSYRNVEPLILYDGVPVFDRGNRMVKYDPKKLKTIEVLNKKYYQGPAMFNSIINFKSYKSNLPDFQLDHRATVVDYEGAQLRREFYAPVYETAAQSADRMPDFRNLLFWSPDVNIDASGKKTVSFFTSDQKGKYLIVIQGITSSGKPGISRSSIEVR